MIHFHQKHDEKGHAGEARVASSLCWRFERSYSRLERVQANLEGKLIERVWASPLGASLKMKALMISSLAHDVAHPGLNESYLKKVHCSLSLMYDDPLIEQHQVQTCYLILQVNTYHCRVYSCQVIYSQFGLAIHQNDHQARRRFVEWAQNEIAVVPDFHKRILFSDEAHFWLNGYVNKQNCRIWSEANPQVYVETPLHPEKLTVWCALWAGGIIGRYFFKNDEGYNVTVNGDRYRAMITNFYIPELNNHDVQELWFQQDGATCHTARATIDLLKDTFGDRLISRFGPVNWPPRSCDLTPLDYFLWAM
ncbi:DDE_3 domain-containing protein [Trichonephila clavipes]|nr:DDE_3 domain-containing protein [Trichonephila clavipes]